MSSAEVFDGGKGWYDEADAPAPINVYGATKLAAERIVLQNVRHSVVRIVLTAGTSLQHDRSFVEDMCRAAKAAVYITLYADEFRCPLAAGDVARAIWELICDGRTGLYHLGGRDRLSRWEIGQLLLEWFPELQGRLVKALRVSIRVLHDRPISHCPPRRSSMFCLFRFRECNPGWANDAGREDDLWDYPAP